VIKMTFEELLEKFESDWVDYIKYLGEDDNE